MKSQRIIISATVVLLLVLAGGVQAQGRGRGRNEHARYARPPANQAAIIAAQRARDQAYRATLQRETIMAEQRAALLQQQNRVRQYQLEQQYLARLRAQQQQLEAERNYARMPGLYAPPVYRYRRLGGYYQTNQYGLALLRQAVQYGYQQGYRAGLADRDDRRPFDYRDNFEYQDGNLGYTGLYVSQSDYNYDFRQGFIRGYEDGYYARRQYGILFNGVPSILAGVLSGILGLVAR